MDQKKTLGLNLIVGPGEQKELERCLESCKGDLFDEIVVTLAMKKEDPVVRQVAEKYTDKIYFFTWIDDFAAARNYSFSKSTATNIMWLDADDELKPKNYEAIKKLKPELHKFDIVIMDYVYTHDEKDNPSLVLPRERIVKNCPEIKWHDPIHEYMNISATPPDRQLRTKIAVDHYRTKPYDVSRNLDKLKKIYDSEKRSPRISFYYGKELSDCGRWDEAIPVLEKYIEEAADFRDNMTVACIRLSRYYIKQNDYDSAKNYAFKGIRFNNIYAENYVMLGMVFEHEKQPDTAEQYYKEALTKKLEGGMSQQVDFYGYIPSAKLALLYFGQKDYDKALEYCRKALEHKPDNQQMIELNKVLDTEIKRLKKGITLNEESKKEIGSYLKDKGFVMSVEKNNLDFADLRIRKSKSLSVVWLIPGLDLTNPSTRVRRYTIHQEMLRQGIKSRIIEKYHGKSVYDVRNEIDDASVVIFTQFSEHELKLMKHLKLTDIKIVFDHCEALFGYKHEDECMREAHLITCCSTKLEEMTRERGYMHTAVLKDPAEPKVPDKPHIYKHDWES